MMQGLTQASGPSTLEGSLAALSRCGTFCWYGPVLGANTNIPIMTLPKCTKLGFALFFGHIPTPELLRSRTFRLFERVSQGLLKIAPPTVYPLADAADAHSALESRKTTGKRLLFP